MTLAQKKAIRNHRLRLKKKGVVRLEVQALEGDRTMIRKIANLLRGDPERAAVIREKLRSVIGEDPKPSRKVLLASAPLEGIDLTRTRDLGRKVEL